MHTKHYFDHAAATPLDPRVLAAMEPYQTLHCANPGALHEEGGIAKKAVENARATIANALRAHSDEIIFTSGGTEGNNLAIQGVFRAVPHERAPHLITSPVEHASVLDTYRALEKTGASRTVLPVTDEGLVERSALERALTPDTLLVSVHLANNEIGVIEPVRELMRVTRAHRKKHGAATPYFHTDASQAPAWMKLSVEELGVDLVTLDAQKLYGPKGVGALYVRRGTPIAPLMYGGNQERGLRPGTPPVPLIVGFAEAFRLVEEERVSYVNTVAGFRDRIVDALVCEEVGALVHGALGEHRLPNNINVSFPGVEGERLVLELDARGIFASTRSACLMGGSPGSAVVFALTGDEERARGAVRFTLGRHTTAEDVDVLIATVRAVVTRLRAEEKMQQH